MKKKEFDGVIIRVSVGLHPVMYFYIKSTKILLKFHKYKTRVLIRKSVKKAPNL